MKIENNVLSNVLPSDLTKDGWFLVKHNVKKVDAFAFSRVAQELKTVVFEGGCEVLGHHAFQNCTNLTKVLLPNTLIKIDAGAFYGTSIHRIEFPQSLKKIENSVCMNCKNLKVVKFKGNVDGWKQHLSGNFDGTLIRDNVFYGCNNIEKFIFEKQPYEGGADFFEWSIFKKAEIVIVDDEIASYFWTKN